MGRVAQGPGAEKTDDLTLYFQDQEEDGSTEDEGKRPHETWADARQPEG